MGSMIYKIQSHMIFLSEYTPMKCHGFLHEMPRRRRSTGAQGRCGPGRRGRSAGSAGEGADKSTGTGGVKGKPWQNMGVSTNGDIQKWLLYTN